MFIVELQKHARLYRNVDSTLLLGFTDFVHDIYESQCLGSYSNDLPSNHSEDQCANVLVQNAKQLDNSHEGFKFDLILVYEPLLDSGIL